LSKRAYLASEDSALLREAMRDYGGDACLEIGAGNGGNLLELAGVHSLAVGTDLVPPGELNWVGRPGNFVLADAATCFRDGSFDLVVSNPPYLPSGTIEDTAVDGGRGGVEVALRFLREAKRVVKSGGRILMLLSSEDSMEDVRRECARMGLGLTLVAQKRLFFENLCVYDASPLVR
jgi:release factor glutamine methyltransferase